jgi:Protein of unknown function (DUF4058)
MPIHDWTRVDAGLFHAFHQRWISALSDALNTGGLPPDYFALVEQSVGGPVPDVLTLRPASIDEEADGGLSGSPVATAPPRIRIFRQAEEEIYLRRADRIAVRRRHGEVVAVIEIVSPGHKASALALLDFVEKSAKLIDQQIHLLVIDLFPPNQHDPQGIHNAIWHEFVEEDFELPNDKPLTFVSYEAEPPPSAYVEPVAIGDVLPDMPIFLGPGNYIPAPLEATYQTAWAFFPAPLKRLLEGPPVEGSGR